MQVLALSTTNKLSFVCPIFDVPTQMRACVRLKEMFMRGERPPMRRGCQACMHSGKCPASEIVRRFSFGRATAEDDLSSETETTGKLPASVLERIAPVAVLSHTLTTYRVPEAEQALIETARERIEMQLRTAPRSEGKGRPIRASNHDAPRRSKISSPPASPKVSSTVTSAAASGDLSAAINT